MIEADMPPNELHFLTQSELDMLRDVPVLNECVKSPIQGLTLMEDLLMEF
jgi:hypothetical protein